MRWAIWTIIAVTGWSADLCGEEPPQRSNTAKSEETWEVRTYPVADLVVPLSRADQSKPEFAALERYLREHTGAAVWNEAGSIRTAEKTLSLVIRQKAAIHDQIADALSELRRQLDVQVVLEFQIVNGPRRDIAALAEAFPGELGKFETDQLRQRIAENQNNLLYAPKITAFSGITAEVATGGTDSRIVQAHATVSADRRSINLKVAEGRAKNLDLIAAIQTVKLHSGRTVVLRFEAPKSAGVIPPAANAEERLVIVTARVIVAEEVEEVAASRMLMVTPRGINIQEEEESLLGIPTE